MGARVLKGCERGGGGVEGISRYFGVSSDEMLLEMLWMPAQNCTTTKADYNEN